MNQVAAIIEMDVERDRKACVALDLKVTGANRELAQWIADHRYPNTRIAEWLGCSEARIRRLRDWAEEGFNGLPNSRYKRSSPATNDPLKSQENSGPIAPEEDDESQIESPQVIKENLLDTVSRHSAWAVAFRRFFKLSSFDEETEKEISSAIDQLISKWRAAQAALTRKRGAK